MPSTPDFKGKDSFKGETFHSAEWKRGFDPKGRRIAVIGTGATSVQIVPNIASEVQQIVDLTIGSSRGVTLVVVFAFYAKILGDGWDLQL